VVAREADPKVDPPAADLEALLAARRRSLDVTGHLGSDVSARVRKVDLIVLHRKPRQAP
jgi:hypothetical protein